MSTERAKTLPTETSYWTTLTDDQLLEVAFHADDPTTLPNVVFDIPEGATAPTVEFAYNTKEAEGRKVRCVHCRYENHNRGFVLRFRDGQRILVGKDCGNKIYGANFDLIERDFDAARDRAGYIRRQRAIRAAAPSFVRDMSSLLMHPALAAFRTLQRSLMQTVPELARLAADACYKMGGAMMIEEKVRDLAAEVRREERMEVEAESMAKMTKTARKRAIESGDVIRPTRRLKPIYTTVPKNLGQIEGQAFFATRDELPDEKLKVLVPAAAAVLSKLDAERLTNTEYRAIFRGLSEKLDEIEKEIERLGSPLAAFEFGHLTRLAEWATARAPDGSVYQADFGAITWTRHEEKTFTVRCPHDYRAPATEGVKLFRAVVSGL